MIIMNLKNIYIITIELSIITFFILDVKLAYLKYITKTFKKEEDNKIFEKSENFNMTSGKQETKYSFLCDFRTLEGQLLLLVFAFTPLLNVVFVF